MKKDSNVSLFLRLVALLAFWCVSNLVLKPVESHKYLRPETALALAGLATCWWIGKKLNRFWLWPVPLWILLSTQYDFTTKQNMMFSLAMLFYSSADILISVLFNRDRIRAPDESGPEVTSQG